MSIISILPENLPDLVCDSGYYYAGLDHWDSLRQSMPIMINYFKENIDSFVNENHHHSWRMLSIGCGNGTLDLSILNDIANRFPDLNVHYEGLDSSSSRLEDFRKASTIKLRSRYNMMFHPINFEQYVDPIDEKDQFDLILCARVLYYMHDRLDATFERLFEKLLKPKSGKILIFQQSPSGIAQITKIVGMTRHSSAHTCNTYHLIMSLDRISSKYSSMYYNAIYLDKYVDMTSFKNIQSHDHAERDKIINLLSFIFGKDLRNVHTDLLEQVVARMLSSITFQSVVDNRQLMFQPVGVIVIKKIS